MTRGPAGAVSVDSIRAALALGHSVTVGELCVLQAHHQAGSVVELLQNDPCAAAATTELAPEIRRHFARGPDRKLALAAGCHPEAPQDIIRSVLARQDVHVLITSTPGAVPDYAEELLVTFGDQALRRAIARTCTREPAIGLLVDCPDRAARIALAGNRSLSSHDVRRLADDEDPSVRAAVARRPQLSPGTLETLATDEATPVRVGAASNRDSNRSTLEAIAEDAMWVCRRAVASNRSAPETVLNRLAVDDEVRVRAAAAGNPSTPLDALRLLAGDAEIDVRRAAARNPAAMGDRQLFDLVEGAVEDYAVAANPTAPHETLVRIADRTSLLQSTDGEPDPNDRTVVLELARNPGVHSGLGERLARWCNESAEGDPQRQRLQRDVALRLAGLPSLAPTVLEELADHDDPKVRERVAKRSDATVAHAEPTASNYARAVGKALRWIVTGR